MATCEQSTQGPFASPGSREREFLHSLKRSGIHEQEITGAVMILPEKGIASFVSLDAETWRLKDPCWAKIITNERP